MAGDLSFKQDNSGLTKKFLLLLFSLSKLKLRPHFQIVLYLMGLSLDYPAFCLSFKRLQFSGGFLQRYTPERVLFFVKNCTAFVDFSLGKKSSYTFDIFQPTFLLLQTFTKSLSITLKSTIFSLHIYSKKRSKKNIIGKNIKTYCTMKNFSYLCKRKENKINHFAVCQKN